MELNDLPLQILEDDLDDQENPEDPNETHNPKSQTIAHLKLHQDLKK